MQQSNLMYDPQRAMWPFTPVDIGNPPFTPHYQCENDFYRFLGYCSSILMAELQAQATKNVLRMYTYNMFTRPGNPQDQYSRWQNEDFMMLVAKTMDWVIYCMTVDRRENFPTIEQAIQTLAPQVVAFQVSTAVAENPELQRFIDQETYNEALGRFQQWRQLNDMLKSFRLQRPVFGYGPGFGLTQAPQYTGQVQPSVLSAAVGTGAQQAFGGHVGVSTVSYVNQRLGRGEETPYERMMRESREGASPPQQASQPAPLVQPFNPRKEAPVVMDHQSTPAVAATFDDGSILIPEAQSPKKWRPSEVQPYRQAYDPATQVRMHRIHPDGAVYVEIHEKSPDMDFEKHNLPNIFGKPREGVPYDMAGANAALARGSAEFAERMKWSTEAQKLGDSDEGRNAEAQANKDPVSVIVLNEWKVGLSEVDIMLGTGIRKLQKAAELGHSPDVFRMYGYVAEPIICQKDQSALLADLADSRSYPELAEKMQTALENGADVAVVETIIRRAIVLVNRVLALTLSIPPEDLSLTTDFDVETIHELEIAVGQDYGSVVFAAFRNQQRNHIESIFQSIEDASVEQTLRDDLLDASKFPEGQAPWLGFVFSAYSFTMLDVYSHDLKLNFDKDTGSLLTDENASELIHIIIDLYVRLPRDKTFYRHVFQTLDGVVLEITEGALASQAYMISRSPQLWFS